ncbi:UbiX family flavin prenyltransferase [Streptomyces sp. RFCAC02]|uniref:UbiX family flavin prenyltransferase n=1 Tax=Streptomyces sp. RFCAC02 TaxID=2499143 RepID=UPI0010227839|nr:UbiX family flavin prenyltransferase [Streptomyces sp. RFCAC02]
MPEQRRVVLAVTGAGGTRLAGRTLGALAASDRVGHVDLLVSANGRRLMAHESGADAAADPVRCLLGAPSPKVTVLDPEKDFAGPPSSGSYRTWGMIVLPCAMGVMGRIAQGQADTLVERAADVCLKERRPLILCVRETPFNLIHLRNMTQVTEAGAVVYPMIPTYYNVPRTVEEMDEEFASRLLGFIGLHDDDTYEWGRGGR